MTYEELILSFWAFSPRVSEFLDATSAITSWCLSKKLRQFSRAEKHSLVLNCHCKQYAADVILGALDGAASNNFCFSILRLQLNECDDEQLARLVGSGCLSQLRELYLSWSEARDISPLDRLGHLHFLDASHCTEICQIGLMKSLRYLYLDWCNGISSLANVAHMSSLKALDLDGCSCITVTCLKELRTLPQLAALGVAHIAENGWMKAIASLPALTSLDISYCSLLAETELDYLESMKLRQLQLRGIRHGRWLQRVVATTGASLASLDLGDSPAIGPSLAGLGSTLTQLQRLVLQNCANVQDSSLVDLQPLRQLHHLNLNGCTKICSAEHIAMLSTTLCELRMRDTRVQDLLPVTALQGLRLLEPPCKMHRSPNAKNDGSRFMALADPSFKVVLDALPGLALWAHRRDPAAAAYLHTVGVPAHGVL